MSDAWRFAVWPDPWSRSESRGQEPCKVGNPTVFEKLSYPPFTTELATDHGFLNYGTISTFDRAGFFIIGLVPRTTAKPRHNFGAFFPELRRFFCNKFCASFSFLCVKISGGTSNSESCSAVRSLRSGTCRRCQYWDKQHNWKLGF